MAKQLIEMEGLFKALADATRLRILGLLLAGEVCVCDIHESLKIPQSKASRHLAYLRRAGLVETRREGLWIHYRLGTFSDPVLSSLGDELAANPELRISGWLSKPIRRAQMREILGRVAGRVTAGAGALRPDAPGALFKNARVLLVEDNRVNQEVARRLLGALGLRSAVAENGQAAVTAIQNNEFDLVLMDCQMPVMDGFAATTEIRRHEQQRGRARNLPIIAITANALQGDRESCLAAGMDDYLSKPMKSGDLAAALVRVRTMAPARG